MNTARLKERLEDIDSVRWLLLIIHLSMGIISFIRPHMVDIVGAYAAFGQVASTTAWGMLLTFVGIGLLFWKRGTLLLIVWQLMSAFVFTTFGYLVAQSTGLSWAVGIYGPLAMASFYVMYCSLTLWFEERGFYGWIRQRIWGRS